GEQFGTMQVADDRWLVQHQRIGKVVAVEYLQAAVEGVVPDGGQDGVDERLPRDHPGVRNPLEQTPDGELPHEWTARHGVDHGTGRGNTRDALDDGVVDVFEGVRPVVEIVTRHDLPDPGELLGRGMLQRPHHDGRHRFGEQRPGRLGEPVEVAGSQPHDGDHLQASGGTTWSPVLSQVPKRVVTVTSAAAIFSPTQASISPRTPSVVRDSATSSSVGTVRSLTKMM